jgi:2-dehydropantoate 2-reductase
MDRAREIGDALLVGAGAVGSVVADVIHGHAPGAVRILADEERMRRYRADGFILNGRRIDFPLVGLAAERPADLVLVAVKTYQLAGAIEAMRGHVGPDTLILSLLNGITSEEELAAAFGAEKVPLAMMLGIDAVREGNATRYSTAGRVHFGDVRNHAGAWSPRVARVARFLDRAGVRYEVPEDMVRALWFKFMINVGMNQASAVLRAPYGPFQSVPETQQVMESGMREVVALSKAMHTGLRDEDVTAWYQTLRTMDPNGMTSMLQDVQAGRRTELEAFAGTVRRLGRTAGVPTPVNDTLYSILRAVEALAGASA